MSGKPFWEVKALDKMSLQEWEYLCDGCGKCCLHKLQCEETDEIFYTDVACRYLDRQTCRCTDYSGRLENVPSCLNLEAKDISKFEWLPLTCAYRLVASEQPLPNWHPLISGVSESIHKQGVSVSGRCVAEQDVLSEDLEEHIVTWVE